MKRTKKKRFFDDAWSRQKVEEEKRKMEDVTAVDKLHWNLAGGRMGSSREAKSARNVLIRKEWKATSHSQQTV